MRKFATSSGSKEKPRYFVQSVAKGFSLLQALSEAGKPLTLSELARSMDVSKTTATRFAYTLIQLGFIYRDAQRRYGLTPKVLTLGYSVIRRQDWLKVAQYYLQRLFREIEETVNLAVLDGKEILYLIRIKKGEDILPFDLQIGSKLSVHCTSMGKILMAFGQEGSAPGEFWMPRGVFIDQNDRIFIADSYNKRIQVFKLLENLNNETE